MSHDALHFIVENRECVFCVGQQLWSRAVQCYYRLRQFAENL